MDLILSIFLDVQTTDFYIDIANFIEENPLYTHFSYDAILYMYLMRLCIHMRKKTPNNDQNIRM